MRPLAAALVVCSLLPAAHAEEVLIGTGTFGTTSGLGADYRQLPCYVSFGIGFSPDDAVLFNDRGYTPADVGQTFTATAETDPDFPAVAAFLADGVNNRIDIFIGAFNGTDFPWGTGNAYPENAFWRQFPRPDLAVAAAGRPITRIDMTINRADTTWDGTFTFWALNATWRVYVTETPPIHPADFNGDGDVNVSDLLAFLGAYRNADSDADRDGDGAIDVTDLLAYLGAYRNA